MKKHKRFAWVLMIVFLLITVADCVVTRIGTPDLSMEANPLISVLGGGWPTLIIANVIVVLIYNLLVYYAFVVYEHKPKDKKGNYTIALFGAAVSFSMIVSRVFVVIEWILHITKSPFQSTYRRIWRALPTSRPDLILVSAIALISAIVWMIHDHRKERSRIF